MRRWVINEFSKSMQLLSYSRGPWGNCFHSHPNHALTSVILALVPFSSLGNLVKEEGRQVLILVVAAIVLLINSCWVVTVPHRESCYPSDPKEIQTLSK